MVDFLATQTHSHFLQIDTHQLLKKGSAPFINVNPYIKCCPMHYVCLQRFVYPLHNPFSNRLMWNMNSISMREGKYGIPSGRPLGGCNDLAIRRTSISLPWHGKVIAQRRWGLPLYGNIPPNQVLQSSTGLLSLVCEPYELWVFL